MALVAHWKCDDNAASTTVVATVGSNATLNGGDNTNTKAVAGPGGSITAGLLLNGSDDRIDLTASSLAFAGGSAYSVSMWFKRSGTIARLIGVGVSAADRIVALTDTTIRPIDSGSVGTDRTVPSMGTSNWHHILATRDSSNSCRLFLDGTESSSGAQTLSNTFTFSYIGYSANSYTNGFAVAQVKIFDSDESANVATYYAEGVSAGGLSIPVAMNQYRQRWR